MPLISISIPSEELAAFDSLVPGGRSTAVRSLMFQYCISHGVNPEAKRSQFSVNEVATLKAAENACAADPDNGCLVSDVLARIGVPKEQERRKGPCVGKILSAAGYRLFTPRRNGKQVRLWRPSPKGHSKTSLEVERETGL